MNVSLDLVRVAGLLNSLGAYSYGFVGAGCTDLMEALHAINNLAILFLYDPFVEDDLHISTHGHTVFAQRSLPMLVAKVDVVVVTDFPRGSEVGSLHKLNLAGKTIVDLTGSLSPENFDCGFYQVPGTCEDYHGR